MLDIFTVSFFGHREVDHFRDVEKQMELLLFKLIEGKDYVDFLVGRNGDFDQIAASTGSHPKAAYQIRNRSMVDRSDLVIFYVTHNSGGAYQTMQYAKSIGKTIINIADLL